ncbi:hypothetical protein BLNAU_24409 [Blattamonas nauphoetae]|uniref:Uncharacterized protein n=1 Tax=Blattamonas nauphoetae TaxID=2049346 RepID=A0ABQ9WMV4_9EUKA|nr:hypothetical protein BLNAU_24409 [Blattamonas nauphoetae]
MNPVDVTVIAVDDEEVSVAVSETVIVYSSSAFLKNEREKKTEVVTDAHSKTTKPKRVVPSQAAAMGDMHTFHNERRELEMLHQHRIENGGDETDGETKQPNMHLANKKSEMVSQAPPKGMPKRRGKKGKDHTININSDDEDNDLKRDFVAGQSFTRKKQPTMPLPSLNPASTMFSLASIAWLSLIDRIHIDRHTRSITTADTFVNHGAYHQRRHAERGGVGTSDQLRIDKHDEQETVMRSFLSTHDG